MARMKATRPENNPTFPATNQNENLAGDSRMSKVLNPIVIGSKSRVKLTALPRSSSQRANKTNPIAVATPDTLVPQARKARQTRNRGAHAQGPRSAHKSSLQTARRNCPLRRNAFETENGHKLPKPGKAK